MVVLSLYRIDIDYGFMVLRWWDDRKTYAMWKCLVQKWFLESTFNQKKSTQISALEKMWDND
jgi:hypothetical protein